MSSNFTIQHGPQPRDRFAIVSNDMLRGRFPVPLRALERVLLLHMISLPSGWRLDRAALDSSVLEGRDAVSKALSGLEAKGYVRRQRRRTTKGAWAWTWLVTEDPVKLPLPPHADAFHGESSRIENSHSETSQPSPSTGFQSMGATCGNVASPQVGPSTGNPSTADQSIVEDQLPEDRSEDLGPPSVDGTSVGPIASAGGDLEAHDEPRLALRLKGLDDTQKTQRLTALWIAILTERGIEPTEDWRRAAGRALKVHIANGVDNRRLIDMVRKDAAQHPANKAA